MRIAFALAVHKPKDERVFYQQAKALTKAGHQIFIISARDATCDIENCFTFNNDQLSKRETINKICIGLHQFYPQKVICDNPLSVLSACKYKRESKQENIKIYYDITEWYPAKIHLTGNFFLTKILKIMALISLSALVGFLADGFIFGEYYKSIPFKRFFFWKKNICIPYYASLNQAVTYPENDISNHLTFFYAGYLKKGYGFNQCLSVVKKVADLFPQIKFSFEIYAKDELPEKTEGTENLTIKFNPLVPFLDFCKVYGKADIYLDLRKKNWENSHSLPIKLFYYMAVSRPVIYTDLKAIKKEVKEIDEVGFLVNPNNINDIAEKISLYIKDKNLYRLHSNNAGNLVREKYNWHLIEERFIKFIES